MSENVPQAHPRPLAEARARRARAIADAGGIEEALASGALPTVVDTTLSEAIILGLLLQEVRAFVGVLGHEGNCSDFRCGLR